MRGMARVLAVLALIAWAWYCLHSVGPAPARGEPAPTSTATGLTSS